MVKASEIINESMTLEEKLRAIDEAMAQAQADANNSSSDRVGDTPIDPQDFLMCEGCQ